ncbi:MAG TPA: cation diffusion facilitator family transporter [Thermoanaerobaculia bacterium]|nr:cation diffusion facilitator family transporter [Thermoanaerobaculia bacterium]
MAHVHHPISERRVRTTRKLLASTIATLLFFGLELGAGIFANALSLISDAFHNITDAVALILALIAVRLSRRRPTSTKSFGYQKAGVLAAFVNAAMLIVLTAFVVIEALERLKDPQSVETFWMFVVASIGVVYNFGVTLWLRREGKFDINVRGAMLHMFADGVSSVGVIVAAILIRTTGRTIWDPIVSMMIAALIVWSALGILRETMNLLIEGTPTGIDPNRIAEDLAGQRGVFGVHHLHVWALGPSAPALSCHLQLGDVSLRTGGDVLREAKEMLAERYDIRHTTIQLEVAGCPEDDPTCIPPPAPAEVAREPLD